MKIIAIIIILVISVSCTRNNVSANYTHEIECTGSELDGSITLKSWGKGKNRTDALEQARKNAVNYVLFKGINNGKADCFTIPILNVPNIRENKADYFNSFFKDGGKYLTFISNQDESFVKKERQKGRDGEVMFGFIIRVLRNELKKQMIKDGILNN